MTNKNSFTSPSSIVIVGSGAFGLSTAYQLTQDSRFNSTDIFLIDASVFPAKTAASYDSSRIVRSDYASKPYAKFGSDAQDKWRQEWGGSMDDRCYHEVGLLSSADHIYVQKSWENVNGLIHEEQNVEKRQKRLSNLEYLSDPIAISKAGGLGGSSGTLGYLNKESGWVDASKAMKLLREKTEKTKRISFLVGKVHGLLFSNDHEQVLGIKYTSLQSNQLEAKKADLTIIATGSWSPTLLDLRGRAHSTAHPLAYYPVTKDEALKLSQLPVQFSFIKGMYMIPPPKPKENDRDDGKYHLKIARHFHGLHNLKTIQHPETDNEKITIGIPIENPYPEEFPYDIGQELHAYLEEITGTLGEINKKHQNLLFREISQRKPENLRLCHYADTPSGDFLVDYHPKYNQTVFIATGDSGHGFKFLPVLGEAIVNCITAERGEIEKKWIWPEDAIQGNDWEWGTEDDSRSGQKGLLYTP